jgi:hypothetical protein
METMMNTTIRRVLIGAAALTSAAALAPVAFAGCGGAPAQPAAYHAGSDNVQLTPVNFEPQGIVGLWSFSFVSGGVQIDWGYTEWHPDGTEITNSGGHSPASGNFCLGVYRQTGPNSFHLKHFPLGYDPTTGLLVAKIILTEDVTVDRTGANYSGPFTLDVYDPTGVTRLQHVTGTVTGHRVLPN